VVQFVVQQQQHPFNGPFRDNRMSQYQKSKTSLTAYRFFSIKMFKLKMLSNFQKPVTWLLLMTSQ